MPPRAGGKNRRTSRPPLTRERVLAVAVELADRQGLSAVTMRPLAAALGVEAMSLYHHLAGKEALLDGLVERIADEVGEAIGLLPPTRHWRAALRQRCLAARSVMLRHPWAPGLLQSRTAIPPRLYLHFESTLATMVGGGLSYHLAHRALHALGSMTLGFMQELFAPARADDGTAAQESANLEEMAAMLPHMSAMVASEIHANDGDVLGWCDSQAEFEFTLDLLLDGLERKRREEARARR